MCTFCSQIRALGLRYPLPPESQPTTSLCHHWHKNDDSDMLITCLLQLELHANEDVLGKPWKQLAKREAKAAAAAEAAGKAHVPIAQRSETTFIPSLLTEFLQVRLSHMHTPTDTIHGCMLTMPPRTHHGCPTSALYQAHKSDYSEDAPNSCFP